MFSRMFSVRAAWLYVAGAVLLLATVFVVIGSSDRAPLGADLLALSRGALATNVLTQSSCSNANGDLPCWAIGSGGYGRVCSVNTYTNVMAGTNGGYTAGGVAGCGINLGGTCNPALQCITGNAVGFCNSQLSALLQ